MAGARRHRDGGARWRRGARVASRGGVSDYRTEVLHVSPGRLLSGEARASDFGCAGGTAWPPVMRRGPGAS